jgi:hypothetical protein
VRSAAIRQADDGTLGRLGRFTHMLRNHSGSASLATLIKATKDILVAWINKRSITVKLGSGVEIKVHKQAELDAVIDRLESSEFIKGLHRKPVQAVKNNPEAPKRKKGKRPRQRHNHLAIS